MGWISPERIQRGRLDEPDEAMPPAHHSSLPSACCARTLVSQPSKVVWILTSMSSWASENSRAVVSKGISPTAQEAMRMRTTFFSGAAGLSTMRVTSFSTSTASLTTFSTSTTLVTSTICGIQAVSAAPVAPKRATRRKSRREQDLDTVTSPFTLIHPASAARTPPRVYRDTPSYQQQLLSAQARPRAALARMWRGADVQRRRHTRRRPTPPIIVRGRFRVNAPFRYLANGPGVGQDSQDGQPP